jgi:hypothetical protein
VGRYLDRVDFWWIAPGVVLVVASFVLVVVRFLLAIARRPNPRLYLFSLRLRQIGFGLLFLGIGAGMFVRGLTPGLDVWSLVVGALIAGLGGLYFIAASDPMFKTGIFTVPPGWRHRPPTRTNQETLEAKAERLHRVVHPEDDSRSPGGGNHPI